MDQNNSMNNYESRKFHPVQNQEKGFWASIGDLIKFSITVLIIVLPIRFFIVEPFVVNGASMDPTFSTGQFLMVDRLSYRFENPQRGDVIVFKYPNNPKVYYIKRIIGLPGETISINDGIVTVTNSEHPDGFILSEPYVDSSHKISDIFDEKLRSDEFFVMGDNRAQSSDSRIWGPLDRKLMVGRPIVRLFPLGEISVFPGEYKQDYNIK